MPSQSGRQGLKAFGPWPLVQEWLMKCTAMRDDWRPPLHCYTVAPLHTATTVATLLAAALLH
eukprot:11587772-Alexandrium_andersonii.AAC.1